MLLIFLCRLIQIKIQSFIFWRKCDNDIAFIVSLLTDAHYDKDSDWVWCIFDRKGLWKPNCQIDTLGQQPQYCIIFAIFLSIVSNKKFSFLNCLTLIEVKIYLVYFVLLSPACPCVSTLALMIFTVCHSISCNQRGFQSLFLCHPLVLHPLTVNTDGINSPLHHGLLSCARVCISVSMLCILQVCQHPNSRMREWGAEALTALIKAGLAYKHDPPLAQNQVADTAKVMLNCTEHIFTVIYFPLSPILSILLS